MRIGTALALIIVGAILAAAIEFDIPVVDIQTVGSILFLVGLLGLVVSLWLEWADRRPARPRAPRDEQRTRVLPRGRRDDPWR